MISIRVDVQAEEVLVRLDTLPRRLRGLIITKLTGVLDRAREEMLHDMPGRYLDPAYIQVDVGTAGSMLVGTLEATQKQGRYLITPKHARFLRFYWEKVGAHVAFPRVNRQYMNPAPIVERFFREKKPWLIDQVEDAVFDAVYNT